MMIEEYESNDSDKEKILIKDETICIKSNARISFDVIFVSYYDDDFIFLNICMQIF